MAYEIPYHKSLYKIPDMVIDGNSTADNPVEFDLAPAWGPDWARIRSIIQATIGLAQDGTWDEATQQMVIASFEQGGQAFSNTVEAIRGLSVPAAMAIRAGILDELKPGQTLATQIPITNGRQFSRICGALPTMALCVASEIAKLSNKGEVDPRLFVQPSGSGSQATKAPKPSTAGSASRTSRRRGTAANRPAAGSQPAGTSPPSPSSGSGT